MALQTSYVVGSIAGIARERHGLDRMQEGGIVDHAEASAWENR